MKIYSQKDGRKIIFYKDNCGKKHCMSYARYLVENTLNIKLNKNQVVHHIDGNKENDVIENLQIKDANQHKIDHNLKPIETKYCSFCGKELLITSQKRGNHLRKETKHPENWFCSKICSGKFYSNY